MYKQTKYTLEREIWVAKSNYSGIIRNKLSSSDSDSVWNGLKNITSYKTPSPSTMENQQLEDDLNEFYCRFGKNTIHTSCNPPLPHTCTADKRRRRAPGLQKDQEKEGTRPRRCDTSRSEILCWPAGSIFTQIFNRSLELCEVPSCFKCSTIISVPKKPKITGFNNLISGLQT